MKPANHTSFDMKKRRRIPWAMNNDLFTCQEAIIILPVTFPSVNIVCGLKLTDH